MPRAILAALIALIAAVVVILAARAALGSPADRAQDARRRHTAAFNALSRTLTAADPHVSLSVRERCVEAVLAALDGLEPGVEAPTEHDHTTGYPTFPADAELVVATSDGPQQWTGATWNEHVTAAWKARNGVAERLVICPPSTCTTTCPARAG